MYARLPLFRRGTEFRLRFDQTAEPVDWNGYTLTLYLDSPDGTVRRTLLSGAGQAGTISGDGETVEFVCPDEWSSENLDQDGDWRFYLWERPVGGEDREIVWGDLPVWGRRADA